MAVYFGGLFSYYGSKKDRIAEFERVQQAVNDILRAAYKERRLRIPIQHFPYRIFPIWKQTGGRYMLIVIGDWAQYVGLETELEFLFPEYRHIFVLYSERDFGEEDNEAVWRFIVEKCVTKPPEPDD